jgi:hypothetical protein
MTNELATSQQTAVATIGNDPFLAYADAVRPQHIIGRLLKHSKGEYLAGEDSEAIPLGTKMIAAMDLLTIGFVHWSGGKPDEHRMVLVADGVQPPRRAELGDTDPTEWEEKDPTGAPRDPWAMTQYLPMVDETGELFTLSTSSRGGIGALAALARQYARGRAAHPDAFPVIELQIDTYTHSNPAFGRIKVPKFVCVGWEAKSTFFKAAGLDTPTTSEGDFDAAATDKMDDAVPF